MTDRGPLVRALAAVASPPPCVASFEFHVYRGLDGRAPDFQETSPHVDALTFAPWRLTYYFDVAVAARPPTAVVDVVHARLLALAHALALPVPAGFHAWLSTPWRPDASLLQVVLGLDAREDPQDTRFKYYAILKGDARRLVTSLCDALEVTPPAHAELARTHIVGVDLTRDGLRDVKLYYALDPGDAARTLRDPRPHAALLRGCRTVVYQHSLIVADKRSMHFHARAPEVLLRELAAVRRVAPWTDQLVAHLHRLNDAGPPRFRPWILAHPWRDGVLDRGRTSLYLHPTRSGASRDADARP